jgi:hypothetical protein
MACTTECGRIVRLGSSPELKDRASQPTEGHLRLVSGPVTLISPTYRVTSIDELLPARSRRCPWEGVEGQGGRFRRTHCVPMPWVDSIAQLNERLAAAGALAAVSRLRPCA